MDEFGQMAAREREASRIARRQWFWLHFSVYATTNAFLIVIRALSDATYPWYIFPLFAWGILIAAHAVYAFVIKTPEEIMILVGPRILLGMGSVAGNIVTTFVGRLEPKEIKSAVAQSLEIESSRDAFAILTDLELRFGRGPFLTPTHVQAALLALEAGGRLTVDRRGRPTLYALQS